MEITDAVTAIEGISTDVGTIATAVILVAAGIMAFRWIKAMFF